MIGLPACTMEQGSCTRSFVSLALFLLFSCLHSNPAHCQGMLRTEKEIYAAAEHNLLGWLTKAGEPQQARLAFLGRGTLWALHDGAEHTSDIISGGLVDHQSKSVYEMAAVGLNVEGGVGRIWEQFVEIDDMKLHRLGAGYTGDKVLFDSRDELVKDTVKKSPLAGSGRGIGRTPYCNPFLICFVCAQSVVYQPRDPEQIISSFVGDSRFLGATQIGDNIVRGVWQIFGDKGSVVEIDFVGFNEGVPVRSVWRRAAGAANLSNYKDLRVYAISKVDLGSKEVDGVSFLVPLTVRLAGLSQEGYPLMEAIVKYRWRLGSEFTVPKWDTTVIRDIRNREVDWRASMRDLFSEDWNLVFDQLRPEILEEHKGFTPLVNGEN